MYNPYTILPPQEIKGGVLDRFLGAGFFRYGACVFSTQYYPSPDGGIYSVFWLRYDVSKIRLDKKANDIIARNKNFSIKVEPFQITEKLESLHQKYLSHITFDTVGSLDELMIDQENKLFDSHIIGVYDGEKLIAAGIFDLGRNSIAGIKNIFDPEYKKYSLGKLLMLLKYNYCMDRGIRWYYPGYYMPENPKFDYKLFVDKSATEVFYSRSNLWVPFHVFDVEVQKVLQSKKK